MLHSLLNSCIHTDIKQTADPSATAVSRDAIHGTPLSPTRNGKTRKLFDKRLSRHSKKGCGTESNGNGFLFTAYQVESAGTRLSQLAFLVKWVSACVWTLD